MAGKKGRSGRKKGISTLMAEAIDGVDQRLPEIFQILIDKALAGDKECAIYLVDRVLGRPRLSIDANTRLEVELSAERIIQGIEAARERARMYLESGQSCDVAQTDAQAGSGSADAGMADEPDGKWDAAGRGLTITFDGPAKT